MPLLHPLYPSQCYKCVPFYHWTSAASLLLSYHRPLKHHHIQQLQSNQQQLIPTPNFMPSSYLGSYRVSAGLAKCNQIGIDCLKACASFSIVESCTELCLHNKRCLERQGRATQCKQHNTTSLEAVVFKYATQTNYYMTNRLLSHTVICI